MYWPLLSWHQRLLDLQAKHAAGYNMGDLISCSRANESSASVADNRFIHKRYAALLFVKWFEVVPIFGGSIFQSCHNMHCDHQTCASTCSAHPAKLWHASTLTVEMNYPWHARVFLLAVGKGSFWLIYFISTGVDWIIDRSTGLIKHPHCMTKTRVTNCVLSHVRPWPSLPVFLILTSSSLTSWFLTLHIVLMGVFI